MYAIKIRHIIISIFLLLASYAGQAQFGVQVGYTGQTLWSKTHRGLIQEFNENNSAIITEALPERFLLHGINVGVSWNSDNYKFELGYENPKDQIQVVGENEDQSLFYRQYFYNTRNYSAGIEAFSDHFGAGLSLVYQRMRIKRNIAASEYTKDIIADNRMVLRPHLSFYIGGGDFMRLAIKPYALVTLDNTNLSPYRNELGLNPEDLSVKINYFGIQLALCYGNYD